MLTRTTGGNLGPGWAEMMSGNATTTTSPSTTAGRTGGATSVIGKICDIEEFEDAVDEQKNGAKKSKTESK